VRCPKSDAAVGMIMMLWVLRVWAAVGLTPVAGRSSSAVRMRNQKTHALWHMFFSTSAREEEGADSQG
jgi:hypothetical protein